MALVLAVVALEWVIHTSTLPGELRSVDASPGESRSDHGRWLPEVTVALEDHRFRAHPGVDVYAIVAAAWSDVLAWRLQRGGSTITQQLVKQVLGQRGRQWRRKWMEAVLALKLERSWSKEAILEGYLNRLDYGNRHVGAESAARGYFNKPCAELTLAEAIYLAGLPQAPSRYNPWRNPERALRKYIRSIARLTVVGCLSEGQARALLASPPALVRRTAEEPSGKQSVPATPGEVESLTAGP